jgi:hypothetical protein
MHSVSDRTTTAAGAVSEAGERSASRSQPGAEEEPRDGRVETARVGKRMQQVCIPI